MTDQDSLPKGWEWTTFGEIANYINGRAFKPTEWEEQGRPIIRIQNLTKSGQTLNRYSKSVEEKYIVRDGELLISWSATLGAYIYRGEEAILNQHIFKVEPHIDKMFLYYLTQAFLHNLQSQVHGSGMQHITKGKFESTPVPLAPLAEQHRIVEAIETLFTRLEAGLAALKQARARLKRYRAAVLKAACEGRLVPQDPTDEPAAVLLERILSERREQWDGKGKYQEPASPPLGGTEGGRLPELPEGWVWASLDQLICLITSGSRGWAKYYSDDGATFIRAQDIKTDALNLASVAHVDLPNGVEGSRTRVNQDDLLVTITGANVTKTALVTQQLDEAYVSQHVGLVRPVNKELSPYLYFWITSPTYGRHQLEKYAYGMGKPGLNLTNLRELMIALPPLAEQQRIVAEVERRLSVVEGVEAAIAANLTRAGRLRQAILKKAFAGELAPQNPDDEPASVLLERIRGEKQGNQQKLPGV